jgi:ubiquitin-conjugating enzyme E2 W
LIKLLLIFAEWSAALTVSSICLSIISMLASAKKKCKPKNDAEFCKRAIGKGPKNFKWFIYVYYRTYDDDKA